MLICSGIFTRRMPLFVNGSAKRVGIHTGTNRKLRTRFDGKHLHFRNENGEEISFEIKKWNVPHLLGIGRLPLRQVHGKYARQLYALLKNGKLTLSHVTSVPGHKEIYKKILNFHYIIDILHCGDAVKVVKQRGTLKSLYLLYLDHRPDEIIHLGIAMDETGKWYPESLLILQRNITAYIDNQIPMKIVEFQVNHIPRKENEAFCI